MHYVIKRIGIFILTLLVISILVFFAFQIIPGDPTTNMLGTHSTPEKVEALREELGLNDPTILRYLRWLGDFISGDFGTSYSYNMPVSDLIAGKIGVTTALTIMSFVIVLVMSFPIATLLARFAHTFFDRFSMFINQLIMSMPPFFIGIIFTYVFGLILNLFTAGKFIPYSESPSGFFGFLFFPALAIALPKSAMVIKLLRGSMIREMSEDYVRTAYSRGNSRWQVLRSHVMRNTIIPVITFLAVMLVDIIAGSIIIEQVFTIPGIGRLLMSSIIKRDFPVVQTIIMIIATVVIMVNNIADISYKYIDPRIRFR